LLITEVLDPNLGLEVGDRVRKIEGKSPESYFVDVQGGISAASAGWLNYRAAIESLLGPENSILDIQVHGESLALIRAANYYQKENERKTPPPQYQFYPDDVIYLNSDKIPIDTINQLMPRLEKSKAIIADLRGYPTGGNHQLIPHLLTKPDKEKWMEVDQLI